MAAEPKELEQLPAEAPRRDSFRNNLRQLWQNLKSAIFRTGKPTSDRARTQRERQRAGVGHLLQDRLGVLVEDFSGVGAQHALGRTVQQPGAKLVFQLAQLLGQRRLGDVQDQGGARQRTVVDDCNEIAELS